MNVPAWVTAGYADPAGRSARYRAQRIAQRLRARLGRVSAEIPSFYAQLSRLCGVFDFPSHARETASTLAARLRCIRILAALLFVKVQR